MERKNNLIRWISFCIFPAIFLFACVGCVSRYPFVVVVKDHVVRTRTIEDTVNKILYCYDASYTVKKKVSSQIILLITNNSRGVLSLGSGRIRITSRNIDYEMNGRFLPLPAVEIEPQGRYELTFSGSGRKIVDEPWQLIAGEQMVLTLRGLLLNGKEIPGHVVCLIPVNPQL
ncbi:MAG: hypothetical protein ABSB78_07190 [Bacteroidota bacterium]